MTLSHVFLGRFLRSNGTSQRASHLLNNHAIEQPMASLKRKRTLTEGGASTFKNSQDQLVMRLAHVSVNGLLPFSFAEDQDLCDIFTWLNSGQRDIKPVSRKVIKNAVYVLYREVRERVRGFWSDKKKFEFVSLTTDAWTSKYNGAVSLLSATVHGIDKDWVVSTSSFYTCLSVLFIATLWHSRLSLHARRRTFLCHHTGGFD